MLVKNIEVLSEIQKKRLQKRGINQLSGHVLTSLEEILKDGITRTGFSDYNKGWATKRVWTGDLCQLLNIIGRKYKALNDAPKQGANGEFVKLKRKSN